MLLLVVVVGVYAAMSPTPPLFCPVFAEATAGIVIEGVIGGGGGLPAAAAEEEEEEDADAVTAAG